MGRAVQTYNVVVSICVRVVVEVTIFVVLSSIIFPMLSLSSLLTIEKELRLNFTLEHGMCQSPISSPSLRLSAPSLRGLRVSGSRKVARPVRVPTEGRVCRHTFSRGRARCQGPSPTVMKRGNFGLINGLVK